MAKHNGGSAHQRAMWGTPKRDKRTIPTGQDTHAAIKWLRSIGLASMVFGWAGVLMTVYYWYAIGAIYCAFILLFLDVFLASELRIMPRWRFFFMALLVILAAMFHFGFVFSKTYLAIAGEAPDAKYDRQTLYGIDWHPEFTELIVHVMNESSSDYSDLNFKVKTDIPVVAISQITQIPDVTFDGTEGVTLGYEENDPSGVGKKIVPLRLLATQDGYRVRCGKLRQGQWLTLILALGEIKMRGHYDQVPPEDKNYVVEGKSPAFTYWLGHPEGDVYQPRTNPSWVKVDGDFVAKYRRRTISKHWNFPLTATPQ